ncbi:MAG: hypothetical protein J4472_01310 [DPANN group archaeon]|nr:MAG: hypothetical protein QJ16_C0005G0194 [archaeon GW2011_AR1]MBS3064426.1 hypothetical protein [DPANN group archaeon]HIH52147.1 hypothetical protein [Nanoarchaeota archaeon]
MTAIENIKILEGKERKEILDSLKTQFGIEKFNGTLLQRGKERIFLYEGSFDEEDLKKLEKITFIERAGIYLGKLEDHKMRLSIEGSQILKNEIKKNIVELDNQEKDIWMMGHEILKKTGLNGFVIMKYKEDLLGTGKASEEKITNFIPKSRRLRDRSIEK